MIELPHPLAAAALARGQHPALVTPAGEALTWGELGRRAAGRASALRRAGVQPDETVALLGAPSLAWVETFWAIGWLGAVPAPLPPRATADERAAALAALGHPRLCVDPAHPDAALSPWPEPDPVAPDAAPWPLEATRLIVLSSGSTGPPRPLALTAAQLAFSAFGSAMRLGSLPDDRWVCPLPLHHVGGLSILLRTAWATTTTVLLPRYDAALLDAAIEDATLVSLVPTMLTDLLDRREERGFPARLRAILVGGAETAPELLARARACGAPVTPSWGMTEAASQIATRYPGDDDPGRHVGPPLPFVRVDADDGLLRLRGPIAPGGDHPTRDRGFLDDRGRVHVLGRADEIIISGGENLDPAEIEAVLRRHPAVRDAAVVGRPDPRWGRRPVAFVVTTEPVPPAQLAAHVRATLSAWKVPDAFYAREALPRTALGKLSRGLLREEAEALQAREQ